MPVPRAGGVVVVGRGAEVLVVVVGRSSGEVVVGRAVVVLVERRVVLVDDVVGTRVLVDGAADDEVLVDVLVEVDDELEVVVGAPVEGGVDDDVVDGPVDDVAIDGVGEGGSGWIVVVAVSVPRSTCTFQVCEVRPSSPSMTTVTRWEPRSVSCGAKVQLWRSPTGPPSRIH
jgi:hypothetical protein